MSALTLDLIKHNGHQQTSRQPKSSLTSETSRWTSSNMDSVPLQSSSRPWFSNEKQNLLLSEKRTLDHWATVQLFFSLAQVRCFYLFQKWLGSPFPEDVWVWWVLIHWLQLQSTPCEAIPSVWIGFAWQYSQACGHPCCLCTFSYPISSFQSTLHLICFDTALLSVMTLCDLSSLWRVSMIVFWTTANSTVFPIIVVSKNKRYTEFKLYGWSFIETQM